MIAGLFFAIVFALDSLVLMTQFQKMSIGAIFFFVGILPASLDRISISCRGTKLGKSFEVAVAFVLTGLVLILFTK